MAVVRIWSVKLLIRGSHSYSGAVLADITTNLGPDSYSGVIFLGSAPFRSWNTEIMTPWLAGLIPRVLSTDLLDLCSTAREFIEGFAFDSDKIHPATKLTWIGAYASQHPAARTNSITRPQSEDALKGVVGKIPLLVLLGKEDKFILLNKLEKLYKEVSPEAEIQIWPGVGHLPFFEEPEKTKDAILAFVNKVTKVWLSRLHAPFACLISHRCDGCCKLCKLNLQAQIYRTALRRPEFRTMWQYSRARTSAVLSCLGTSLLSYLPP